MKGRNTLLVMMATGLLLSLPAQAQRAGPPGPGFDDRLDRQEFAIQRGIDSGELTRRETRMLRREQDEVRQFMRDVRRAGYPPHEARYMIDRRLDHMDRRIHELSHNSERRPPPPPPR